MISLKKRILRYLQMATVIICLTAIVSACAKPAEYDSHKKLGPQINYTITGIEAGAGEMANTQTLLSKYKLKQANWQIMPSSTAAMISTLSKAVKNKQPIVVTGWQPHWMVAKYSLKFLKDPKHVYGNGESMRTITRKGLEKDNPGATKLLKNFHWTISMSNPVMLNINGGMNKQKAVNQFIKNHPKQVKAWTAGVPNGHGKKIKLVYTPYAYEIAATTLVTTLLKQKGYKATMQQLDVGVMWNSIANGSSDASVTAELPVTQGLYAKKYKGKYVQLRKNLKGAQTGLAVPKYMKNINTVDDLKNK